VKLSNTIRAAVFGVAAFVCAFNAAAQAPKVVDAGTPSTAQPQIFSSVGIDQHLDAQVPLGLMFKDETGKNVHLVDYFGKRPVILTLVYYQCPMLCTQVLNGLTSSVNVLKFDIGKDYDVLTVSIDPRETPEMARAKKDVYVSRYRRPTAPNGWHFLTGDQENISKLARAVGFRYAFDKKTDQFAHASGIMVLTPDGKVAQYYYGIEYSPKDLRLALIDASQHKIGNIVDEVMLFCYHYDPTTGRYNAAAIGALRVAGILTLVLLGGFIFISVKRESKEHVKGQA
jgi:protein SCO1